MGVDHEHAMGNLIRELRNEEHIGRPAPEKGGADPVNVAGEEWGGGETS